MHEKEAVELISKIIGRTRGIPARDISADTRLADDLGLDSLDAAELLAMLHRETGTMLDATSVKDFETVQSVASRLLAAQEESHA
ncbi:acyl carrier protein [Actinomadura darangshiensis]|uniref:Acyl carrier protein n=1 Tax=Actinomadura darangshiensis TaxID=705336 RepID=A0A4V2YU43_9ACTN|nr:acyl carrier protein [Actinomadura darangshiensis]TDD75667.1 acyl carrier protein [Actinomadura darangshiensis]